MVSAGNHGNRLTVTKAVANGTEHLFCNQLDNLTLACRQSVDVGLTGNQCGNDCVVVGHLFTVADLSGQNFGWCRFITDTNRAGNNGVYTDSHILGEVSAVGTGIGAELLFIEALNVVQSLLCGVTELSVCIPLEGGQVVECRSFFSFLLACNGLYHHRLASLGNDRIRFGLLFEFLARCGKRTEVQFCGVKGFGLESSDLCFSLNEQSQSRRYYTTDIQSAVIEDREKTGRIDSNEPICPLTATGGGKEIVVLLAVLQITEALLNGIVLHRGNPKSEDGLFASGHLVDITEDQLALTSCIAGVDNVGHVGSIHQLFQRFKLAVLITGDFVLPVGRNDGKIVVSPLGVFFIVGVGIGKFSQMTEAPGHDIITPLDVAVLAVFCTENRSDRHSHGGFFSNYKSFHGWFSPCLFLRRMLSLAHAPRGAFSNASQKRDHWRCPLRHLPT